MTKAATEGRRILVCAPFGRDAESLAELLRRHRYDCAAFPDLDRLSGAIGDGAAAILATQEALVGGNRPLRDALEGQPGWSDLPLILLASRRPGAAEAAKARLFGVARSVVVLERPLGADSLITAVAYAMRSRQRQFELRDRIADLAQRNAALDESQRALRESEARFAAIANSIDQMVWSTRPDGHHDYYNDRWYEFTGVPYGSTDGEGWNGMFHPDDRDRAWAAWRFSLATGAPYQIEYRLRHRSGDYRWVLGRAQAQRDEAGAIVRWFGTCTVIHELIEAREVLARSQEVLEDQVAARTAELKREMASRLEAEAALRQSQKMEAVGQLTGGIAHDFNNMLTGVIGALDLVKRRIASGRTQGLAPLMDAASASAQRAVSLTARLLAFSRRQSLDAKPHDANALIGALDELLRRTVRENVALRFVPGAGLPPVVVDANQLENAILNLAINARDAMPDGGTLTIETAPADVAAREGDPAVPGGRFVVIAVRDTGVGMGAEILEKVFDPFFTTKPIGQGTGLGLSMVHGFVHQSGGFVTIDSAPGAGATVSLYLPAADDAVPAEPPRAAAAAPTGLGQTVLLVEDDPAVRMLVREVLDELAYAAIEAQDAGGAVAILSSGRAIDLMISDVGLPGMNGRQLAELARRDRPGLPILFITGYAENAAIRADFLGTRMAMLTKPFSLDTLAAKISEMLGREG